MIVVIRFTNPGPAFETEAQRVVAWWAQRPGCLSLDLVRNIDEPHLWAIVGHWESVGAYRRSFNGHEAKLVLTPLLSQAMDEPSAFLSPQELGDNLPRTT